MDFDGNISFKSVVMKFDGINWINVGTAGFSAGRIYTPDLVFSPTDNNPYIAFSDWGVDQKASVMHFDGNSWLNVGTAGISGARADFTSLAFNPANGQPYIAFRDYFSLNKATVMKYDSTSVGLRETPDSGISVYPNPAVGYITIEIPVGLKGSNLSITKPDGLEMINRLISESKTSIDISRLCSGIYILRICDKNTVVTKKFIKH